MGGAVETVSRRSAAVLLGGALLIGCAGSRETEAMKKETRDDLLRRYEATFRPSDYDRAPTPTHHTATVTQSEGSDSLATPIATPVPEEVPGFRVQIVTTASIDEANQKKIVGESLFPNEWFYLEYDQPTFKIRAGNFLTRFEAERFRALIAERGFSKAWVVPARVFKHPPPPPRIAPDTPR
jgi:hypothetical protein